MLQLLVVVVVVVVLLGNPIEEEEEVVILGISGRKTARDLIASGTFNFKTLFQSLYSWMFVSLKHIDTKNKIK